MERLIERCCGLDVHKATVGACVRVTPRPGGEVKQEVRTFATTAELLALREWLTERAVTHVAMEATGVYWKPVYYLLENDFELLLVNPAPYGQNIRRIISAGSQKFRQAQKTGAFRISSRRLPAPNPFSARPAGFVNR